MLQSLTVKNLALVDRIGVEFAPGLNVITGPTGAGKTLLIKSLKLALGGRADFDLLNDPDKEGVVSAFFILPEKTNNRGILEEYAEGSELQFRRVLKPSRQSRAYLNGEQVRLETLRKIRGKLIDFHGQHDQQAVFEKDFPRRVLDRFGDYDPVIKKYREIYEEFCAVKKELNKFTGPDTDYRREMELLDYQLEELNGFGPEENEWEEIESKRRRLEAREEVDRQLREALQILDGDNSPPGKLGELIGLTANAAEHMEELEPWPAELENIKGRLSELRLRLREERERLEHSAGEYENLMDRRGNWLKLARKYNIVPEKLYSYYREKKQRLEELGNRGEKIKKLKKEKSEIKRRLQNQAEELTTRRRDTAEELAAEVSRRLKKLNLAEAVFRVEIDKEDYSESGADRVRWLFSSHSSHRPGELAERISGGEISRVLLAIKSALAGADTTLSLVFDEIDAGISGQEANSVGLLLSRLARYHQVVVITHLPIVAAHGDHHIRIAREDKKQAVNVRAGILEKDGRLEELSRLLSGDKGSEVSHRQAEKLLEERKSEPSGE